MLCKYQGQGDTYEAFGKNSESHVRWYFNLKFFNSSHHSLHLQIIVLNVSVTCYWQIGHFT